MSPAERLRRIGILAAVAVMSAACTTVVIVGEKQRASPRTHIIRVATERGIADALSTRNIRPGRGGTPSAASRVQIEVPLEVHTGADSVLLSGCALQPFRMPAVSGPDFTLDSISSDPDLLLVVPAGVDPVVPPGTRRIVTIHLTKGSSDPAVEAFGIRIDERGSVLGQTGACPPLNAIGDSIQHFAFRRLEVEPLGPAVAAAVIGLFSLVVIGR